MCVVQVGATVHVIAERPHPLAGWRASRVEVTEIWNSDEVEERKVSPYPEREGELCVVFSLHYRQ